MIHNVNMLYIHICMYIHICIYTSKQDPKLMSSEQGIDGMLMDTHTHKKKKHYSPFLIIPYSVQEHYNPTRKNE